jgi:isoleucyl-tRNA synthetase
MEKGTQPTPSRSSSYRFVAVPERLNFAQTEEEILSFWEEINAFQTSLELSKGKPLYTFYDGPPFATGLPHYGHILAGTIKDTVTRFFSQKGFHVPRRFGWDCHGLPIEFEIEKELGIKVSAKCKSFEGFPSDQLSPFPDQRPDPRVWHSQLQCSVPRYRDEVL